MENLDKILKEINLDNSEDIDALVECASVVRRLVDEKNYDDINRIIRYTVENGYYEALLWTMGIISEEFQKTDCRLDSFSCMLGGRINGYDDFVQALQVDFNALKNTVEKVYDNNGEVESFFNIFVYKTGFENICLVSSENFDTKDNDYIHYRLSFGK